MLIAATRERAVLPTVEKMPPTYIVELVTATAYAEAFNAGATLLNVPEGRLNTATR